MLASIKNKTIKDIKDCKDEFLSIMRKGHYTVFVTSKVESEADIISTITSIIKSYNKDDIKVEIYVFENYFFIVLGEEGYEASDKGSTIELSEWEGMYYQIAEELSAERPTNKEIKMIEEL